MPRRGLNHEQEREARQRALAEADAEREQREAAVSGVEGRTETLEGFKDRPQGFASSGHDHDARYSQQGHGHNYAEPGHGHAYSAIVGTHDNEHHEPNYAISGHTHSQSVKLMGRERRAAAVALRERIRAGTDPEDLRDGILFVMALLFDDASEALDETLARDADEQLVLHLWESSGFRDPGDARAPEEAPHPDLDRIAGHP